MFQTFDPPPGSGDTPSRLAALRAAMREAGADWYLVPRADEQQNEYLPACAERLAWLTGFTGSAGFALVGIDRAFLFVDGRYTLQAGRQADTTLWEVTDLVNNPPARFAEAVLSEGQTVACDPWLMTIAQYRAWQKVCEAAGASLRDTANLVDLAWKDRPKPPLGRAFLHPVALAGMSSGEKIDELRERIARDKADWLLMTDPASVAWTFNLRGSDVTHNPLALAFAMLPAENGKPLLFIDRRKLEDETETALEVLADLRAPSALEETLGDLAGAARIHCDPTLVGSRLAAIITENGGTLVEKPDPVALLRAIKNTTELEGTRAAHLRDGIAMVRFLAWLDGAAPGTVDEITAATTLEALRSQTAAAMASELREIAFDTISGAGANGAIIHYRVNRDTNAVLEDGTLYLTDSGGQYPDGTTDITRTVAIGRPPESAANDFTLVLKGHVAIATARFPAGTRGVDLDPLARMALWQAGKDFAHGTGHGVGSYLNVHEGPQSISRRGMQELLPGMIVSNEPGYYREGEYGIRLENLVVVNEPAAIDGGDKPMLGFETLTLCPFDRRLIDVTLLTAAERDWLNAYHARVRETLSPHLGKAERKWLEAATKPLR